MVRELATLAGGAPDGCPVGEGSLRAIEMEKLFSGLTSAIRLVVSGLPGSVAPSHRS